MNKFAKGAIAAGAGIVLLLGGAGSLAYWNAQDTLDGGSISAGTLTLEVENGAWESEIATWVPGDSATYTADLVITAVGDNIQGTVAIDTSSIDGDIEFFEVTSGFSAAEVDGAGVFNVGNATFSGPGIYTVPVEVTVTFPFGTVVDNNSKQASLDLAGIAFTVTQTAVTP